MENRVKKFCKPVVILAVIVFLFTSCGKGNNVSSFNGNSSELQNIYSTIDELTSKKYDGRLVGTEGNRLAENYVADYFKQIGLESSKGLDGYRQKYTQRVRIVNQTPRLEIIDKSGRVIKEFKYRENFSIESIMPNIKLKADLKVPLSICENDLDLSNIDVKGKVLMIPKEVRESMEAGEFSNDIVLGSLNKDMAGAIVETNLASSKREVPYFAVSPYVAGFTTESERGSVVFYADTPVYNEIKAAREKGLLIHMKVDCSIKSVEVSNLVGLIPGKSKEEFIVIGAHFDHVGDNMDGTYNPGALDNASGISVLMEIAKIVKNSNKQPQKSILFVAFNGEEEGLYGSEHYAQNPVYPLNKAVVINLDMFGSKNPVPLSIVTVNDQDNPLQNDILEYAKKLNISAEKSVGNRSDHVHFTEAGAPAVSIEQMDFKSGYHSPGDTKEVIDMNKIKDVTSLVLYYIDQKAY